jgi:hypothetical protein
MNLASRIASTIAGVGIIAGVSIVGIALAIGLAIALFAAITAFQAVIVYLVWNLVAPMFSFVPAEYQSLGFLQVWGAVAVIRIVGRVLFATVKKDSK